MPGRLAAQILPPTIPSTVGAEQLGAKKNERSRERETRRQPPLPSSGQQISR
jgi:hypothetical protein